MESIIQIQNFALQRGSFKLNNICLDILKGEIFALLGKTGAGKTMLLEAIAGHYKGYSGRILLNGIEISGISGEIGFVYQDYSLFPHMTVFQNISYGLKMRKLSKAVIEEKVSRIIEMLSISHIRSQYPGTLSGGERQRTALARALILNPEVLLLDEPFAALDNTTKQSMYDELRKIYQTENITIVLVTHDFNEAQKLAHRIGIMSNGDLKTVRNADDLFLLHNDADINRFLGLENAI